MALLAGIWHAILLTRAANDNFLHMTLAQQLLAGDWPVRDFFDHGWVLQYALSAGTQALAGDRLASEALVVASAWAVSTYLVFTVTRRLTGSRLAAALAASLLIVAGPRGYSYPKGIVYGVAAALWWAYVGAPSARRAVALGIWAAVAFYWRPDHGLYVALGVAAAMVAAHGLRGVASRRCAAAGAATALLVSPFLIFVHAVFGLPQYVQTGFVQAQFEHESHGAHRWPLLSFAGPIADVAPAADYAPVAAIRWSTDSTAEGRQEVLTRYGLTDIGWEDSGTQRVRLSDATPARIRALMGEAIVVDTAGIDRSTGTIPDSAWPAWQRWSFEYPALRLRFMPSVDRQARGAEIAAALFYLIPLLALAASPWIARSLGSGLTAGRLAAFAVFALILDLAMIREPLPARVQDAVVLPSVLFGCLLGALVVRRGGETRRSLVFRLLAGTAAAGAVVVPVAAAGAFVERLGPLAGGWTSLARARQASAAVRAELMAEPPLARYIDRSARLELRLAAYVRACTEPADRLLVLWFAPDIYYYSNRLMAQRHLVFAPPWADLSHEQQAALAKINRARPPLTLARRSSLESQARATYPGVVEYVEKNYDIAGVVHEGGEEYLILARRDRVPVRQFGDEAWPCFAGAGSVWDRVGQTGE